MTLLSILCPKLREARRPKAGAYPDPTGAGIRTTHWFWASSKSLHEAKKKHSKKWDDCVDKVTKKGNVDSPQAVCTAQLGAGSYESAIAKLTGKTLPRKKKEADSASSFPATTVGKAKETAIKFNTVSFHEAAGGKGDALFNAVLIREGMGNMHDAFYYTKEALESAIPIFEGAKAYADHPTASEEDERPERTTRDIIGHYEGLAVQTGEDGCAELCGKLDVLQSEQWAIDRINRAVKNTSKFPDKPFIGFSINANGDAEETPIDEVISMAPDGAKDKLIEAKANGIDTVRVVRKIKSAVSCDLVTQAGAGGKAVNNLNEGEK